MSNSQMSTSLSLKSSRIAETGWHKHTYTHIHVHIYTCTQVYRNLKDSERINKNQYG